MLQCEGTREALSDAARCGSVSLVFHALTLALEASGKFAAAHEASGASEAVRSAILTSNSKLDVAGTMSHRGSSMASPGTSGVECLYLQQLLAGSGSATVGRLEPPVLTCTDAMNYRRNNSDDETRADSSRDQRRAKWTTNSSSSLHETGSQSTDQELTDSNPLPTMQKMSRNVVD